ncbi:MAG: holo-[acyl-carrier-protein] synthase [Candidatus Melainabacteria bacterium]|nr:MAG: holo-[acyl-carrier-protein] synthase [Candidatus Melainabacteria bacterium]
MFKVGIDICSIDRIRSAYDRYGERFLSKILTANESGYVLSRQKRTVETLAGRFAAKEAVAKVLGVGWRGINWKEIEIERCPSGAPQVILHGRAEALARKLNLTHFEVSLSHERDFAVASAIGYSQTG